MTKDLKKTGVFAVFVFSFFLFVLYEINKFKKIEEVKEIKDKVVGLEINKINQVDYKGFVFERDNLIWKSTKGKFKDILNKDRIEAWLSMALNQDGRRLSEKGEQVNWDKFGFNKEAEKLSLSLEDETKSLDLILSTMRPFDGGVYLKVVKEEGPILYSSTKEWFEFFNQDLEFLREQKAFDWSSLHPGSLVKKIDYLKSYKSFKLAKEKTDWISRDIKYKNWNFDNSKVLSAIDDIKGFMLNEFILEKPKALKTYGKLNVLVGDKSHSLEIYVKNNKYYGSSSLRPGIFYSLEKENIDTFFPSPWDLRSHSDAFLFQSEDVIKLSYSLKNTKKKSSHTFSKSQKGEWLYKEPLPKNKVFNGGSVLKLFSLMKAVSVERYLKTKPLIQNRFLLQVKRTNKNGKSENFTVFKNKVPCVKNETKKKDCHILSSKGLYLAVKKEKLKELLNLDFFKDNTSDDSADSAGGSSSDSAGNSSSDSSEDSSLKTKKKTKTSTTPHKSP